ncbi:MAG TPA: FAD-dependent oxidoreductase [Rhizomicrobium sp.]|nr:FAD-dependent oxidoreductase [Rhizomicrobium sp.]
MSARADAIVIGGSVGGLAAAAYLRHAGLGVTVLEASEQLGGSARAAQAFHALDPLMLRDLGLTRRGLKLAARDLPLVGLRQDGRHLVLARDPHVAARAIAAFSAADAQAYKHFHAELFALARALRPWWCEDAAVPQPKDRLALALARLEATSANAWLGAWFETEALRAALAFDAPFPDAPGSALALVWRAAQEMGGLQGAVAQIDGGGAALAVLLTAAVQADGAELRTKARVKKLLLADDEAAGVELDTGEQVFARRILSSLSRRDTLLSLAPTASAGIAETLRLTEAAPATQETEIVFTLNAAPQIPHAPARLVVTEGDALEAIVTPSSSPGQHLLTVTARGTPGDDAVIAGLERFAPQLKSRIVAAERRTRDVLVPHLMESATARISTPIKGLTLCGRDAEPMAALSGRAGRLAAVIAAREKGA